MNETIIKKAASQYGEGVIEIATITEGLIHHSYKISFQKAPPILLQYVNQAVFKEPEKLILNYELLQKYLSEEKSIKIPRLQHTHAGKLYWTDNKKNFWRAFDFIKDSYSLNTIKDDSQAFSVARSFGRFTKSFESAEINQFYIVLPRFHDLPLRYDQFKNALGRSAPERLNVSGEIIEELQNRNRLVIYYEKFDGKNFPLRIMHHDCKVNNVLFDKNTDEIICLVDLDTVMPGYFFSDLGDMIRTMACTNDENSIDWKSISVQPHIYKSIVKGYLEGIEELFTNPELENIHYSGILMIYMQCLRFLTDFLNNDIYYKTNYAEQNLHRAYNQYLLLKQLEVFLEAEYNFRPYY